MVKVNILLDLVIKLLIITILFVTLYKIKSQLGINFIKTHHFPDLLEKVSGGIVPNELFDHNYIP